MTNAPSFRALEFEVNKAHLIGNYQDPELAKSACLARYNGTTSPENQVLNFRWQHIDTIALEEFIAPPEGRRASIYTVTREFL